ncbi:hypothetical protein EJ08DRAFT_644644 [Tothia fuscella]|uniref:GST N-terminal domain-containing protein n=1 Tax=Tothia fuscella TaxID=1048955 RepID=A0A9P4P4F0_9PEZI|nr:hypothetical protein EJ08DRAFT_644644 [Tothia fuscella]
MANLPLVIAPMKLIYHPLSPYSRKAYMAALEYGLADTITLQKVVVCPTHYPGWSDNVPDLVAAGNPLAKIPTLVIQHLENGDIPIFDSRVICGFLRDISGDKSGSSGYLEQAREGTLLSIADGILDAQILITYELRIRAEKGLLMPEWLEGQKTKQRRGLDALERHLEGKNVLLKQRKQDEPATIAEITVAAMVGCIIGGAKDLEWSVGRPKLAAWFEVWKQRESFTKTRATIDWKTGEKIGLGPNPSRKFDPKAENVKL